MDITPFHAPTYFAPAYFAATSGEATIVPDDPAVIPPYRAPAYFAPAYFYDSATVAEVDPAPIPVTPTPDPVTPTPEPANPGGVDGPAYGALLDRLRGTGLFEVVAFDDPGRRAAGASGYPQATVRPRGWEEVDDFDPSLVLRKVSFTIRVAIRVGDDAPAIDQLDRMTAVVRRVVDRASLGGRCLPPLTRIRAARYDDANLYPEGAVLLDGEFATFPDLPPSTLEDA